MANSEQPTQIPPKQHKSNQLESLIGPLLSNWGPFKFDDFQFTLFDLIANASEAGIQQYVEFKSNDIYKFLLTLFITSLHKNNPLRLVNNAQNLLSTAAKTKPDRKHTADNPLNSILVSPPHTLPPPPKRRHSQQKAATNNDNDNADNITEPDTDSPFEHKNKNNNIDPTLTEAFLERNLSGIEESKEKDKYVSNGNVFDTPPQSSDVLISNKNKNYFDDILLSDNENDNDNDFSKTYESYDGDEFFATRSTTTREYTTTEKFKCNPKEKAVVEEWRHLLHDIKETPSPQPILYENENEGNEEKEDAVIVPTAEAIKQEQEDNDMILIETAEMIAPMTRIKGKFKLTSTSITFIPDAQQPSKNKEEVNLAMNPPPLPLSPRANSSRARSSSYGVVKSAVLNEAEKDNMEPELDKNAEANGSVSRLTNKENEYWVATSVCSSYQQVGGTRYRLMTAHRFWFIDELREIYYRRYQLRNCAFELFFSDDTSWLFNLYDEQKRDRIFNAIMTLSPSNLIESKEFFKNPKKAIKSSQIHYKWCRREITNFEYLMRLNVLAGRTFNDLTQYPVVPWVIADFESPTIDTNDPKIYRDLSKPIGALNEARLNKFKDRYQSLCEDRDINKANNSNSEQVDHCFMYGTHYSSIGIVLYYLLRMQPFTAYNLKFQGGKFDHADRLFHSVRDSYQGCMLNMADVKELIPEFYYLTDFLWNKQSLNLGVKQENGDKVDDVKLPPWADGKPERFVQIMREALESEHVSSHLHLWIDLIFGCKQRGKEAELANNIFHPHTYSGNVAIDEIADDTQRRAILAQIDEFGQTPMQLFSKKHQKRLKNTEVLTTIFQAKSVKYYSKQHLTDSSDVGIISMSWNTCDKQVIVIGSDCCLDIHKWEQNKLSIEKKSKSSIASKIVKFGKSKKSNKICSSGASFSSSIRHKNLCFATTRDGQYIFGCGFEDNSFVVWDTLHNKIYQNIKKHSDIVSCLALDEDLEKQKAILVTGSYDKSVMVWRINLNAKQTKASKTKNKKNKSHSRKHSLPHSMSLKRNNSAHLLLNELVDPNPTHILDNLLAGVLCVDVSLKSGLIVCCSLDGIVNVYNASTGEHYHLLQPYIDKALRIEKRRKERKLKELSPSPSPPHPQNKNSGSEEDEYELKVGSIPSGELTIVRVSSVFGHILCYSKQTKDIFLYASNGQLMSYSSSRDDTYYDVQFSKSGNHMVCGGSEKIVRVKELPSFKTRKKFEDPKKSVSCIFLDKDETYMFVGLANGNVLVYSLPQKAFVKSRVHTLTELGF